MQTTQNYPVPAYSSYTDQCQGKWIEREKEGKDTAGIDL